MNQKPEQGLYLEWTPAAFSPVHAFQHAYIVYRDGKGGEWVLRGGPEADAGLVGGDTIVENGIPLKDSKDAYGPGDTPQSRNAIKLDIGTRDPAAVFEIMKNRAEEVSEQEIDYNLATGLGTDDPNIMQNSNSVVRAVMQAAAIPVPENLPLDQLPGFENDLTKPQDGYGLDAYRRRPDQDVIPEYQRDLDLEKTNPGGGKPIEGAKAQPSENGIEGGSADEVLLGGADDDTLSAEQQLIDTFTADDGQSEVLYKRTEDITQAEMDDLMASDAFWEANHPDYLATKAKAQGFFDLTYGTEPAERDATGRTVQPEAKRAIPTETQPAKAKDGTDLKQSLAAFAKALSAATAGTGQADQVKTAQEAVNILNSRSKTAKPLLAVDGQAGPKTRAGLRQALAQNKAAHVQDASALASFKPTVQKAAQSGIAQGMAQAAGKSFGGLFAKPLGAKPLGAKSRGAKPNPQGLGLQIAVNDAAEDHGLVAAKAVEPLKEDGIPGPKTEAAFGKVAQAIGSDEMLDRVGQGMGLFG